MSKDEKKKKREDLEDIEERLEDDLEEDNLKTLINTLKEHDNVIILSATNYPELIEGAIDSRMAEKILFNYLTPKQIITAITEHYKNFKKNGFFFYFQVVAIPKISGSAKVFQKNCHLST